MINLKGITWAIGKMWVDEIEPTGADIEAAMYCHWGQQGSRSRKAHIQLIMPVSMARWANEHLEPGDLVEVAGRVKEDYGDMLVVPERLEKLTKAGKSKKHPVFTGEYPEWIKKVGRLSS
jgi:hypothetical protein